VTAFVGAKGFRCQQDARGIPLPEGCRSRLAPSPSPLTLPASPPLDMYVCIRVHLYHVLPDTQAILAVGADGPANPAPRHLAQKARR
jgi:hypothetical protein